MKKVVTLVVSLALLLSTQTAALAHPGRTDANGGHNCSEKSKQKGLCTGYHYHNSGTTNSSSKSKSTTKSKTSNNNSSSSKTGTTGKRSAPKPGYTTVDITLIVNGSIVPLDQKAVIVNGTILLPLKNMFDALGATLEWDQAAKKITASKDGTTVELTVDSTAARKQNKDITLQVKPIVINGYTMVPARFAAESFDAAVEWDSLSSTITITTP
ncbi:copper amine oxidase N-terminal domain-containing protein [Paenibacillus ihumii]|uniref:copper amine oxidase N-terminal domain-containing protein n=1 Tax=Paenibacillus ihumii TaxID=687436 RepID=UPI0006D7DB01|nr:copper amine oxidase N-terminal domain-containing protein [Paenibacillus ihumii]